MKILGLLFIFCVLLVSKENYTQNSYENLKVNKMLAVLVSKLNQDLPKMVDNYTLLTKVDIKENNVSYLYEIRDMNVRKYFDNDFKFRIYHQFCSNFSSLRLLSSGFNIEHRYYKNEEYLRKFKFTKEKCEVVNKRIKNYTSKISTLLNKTLTKNKFFETTPNKVIVNELLEVSYTLILTKNEIVDFNDNKLSLFSKLKAHTCARKVYINLLKKGFSLNYNFFTTNDNYIGTLKLSNSDCMK
jgi:hypothetical protein